MALKSSTDELIKLLESVPIEVNYKHDIFLREITNFQQYVSKSMQVAQSVAGEGLSDADEEILSDKKAITFAQIKLDIIDNKGEAKLKELEESYIRNTTCYALASDDELDDSLKDAIADAFFDFFSKDSDSYVSKLNDDSLYKSYINKVNKVQCLVYTEDCNEAIKEATENIKSKGLQAKKDRELLTRQIKKEYTVPNLEGLLDTIARVSVCYCIGTTDYKKIDPIALKNALLAKSAKKSSKDKTVPLFIRKVIGMVCYCLLNMGNKASIEETGKQVDSYTGVTFQIMQDLHSRCELLGYPYFTKENKVFQFDKWSLSPEEMLRRRSYIAPKMPFTYLGIKEGYLGYMISQLQSHVVYDKFLDAFGGSGASSVQFRHNKDAKYFINDFNYCIVSFYKVMQAKSDVFDEFICKLDYIWKLYIEAYELAVDYLRQLKEQGKTQNEANKKAGDEFYIFSNAFFNMFKSMADFSWNVTERNNVLNTPLNQCSSIIDGVLSVKGTSYEFPDEIKKYAKKNISYIDAAVLYAYFVMHPVTGAIEPNIFSDKIIYKNRYSTLTELKQKFASFRSVFSSEIVNEYGESAMNILKNKNYNAKGTLAYLDSPYIGTVGYAVSNNAKSGDLPKKFTQDSIGVEGYFNDFDMKDLLDCCRLFEGYYIFSCRENMVHSDVQKLADRAADNYGKISNLTVLLNNYIWFWRQWQSSSDLVLFMYDLDYSPASFHPFVEKFLNTGVKDTWGTNIDEDLKKNIIQYLFSRAFDGKDLEIMITNFTYDDIKFDDMYEHKNNIYNKQTDAFKKIPDRGMFVSMPVSTMADIVLSAMQVFVNRL